MLLHALADGVIALAARQSGSFSVCTAREFALLGGVPREGRSSAELARTATPIVPSNRGEPANRPAKAAGTSGGKAISPSLYSRTKERPDRRLRTEIRIDQTKSERDGIMRGVFWATDILGGI